MRNIELEFDYMWRDKVVAHVVCYDNFTYDCEVFGHGRQDNPLKDGVSLIGWDMFLSRRTFPKDVEDLDSRLAELGLTRYNRTEILQKTHGVSATDFYWCRFKGEELKYNDVKIYG